MLLGYPTVSLLDRAGRALPFVYTDSGGIFVTRAAPSPVRVAPGVSAVAAFEKFRCDIAALDRVDAVRVGPPDDTQGTTLRLPAEPGLGYCGPKSDDPGNIVNVTTFEPTTTDLSGGP